MPGATPFSVIIGAGTISGATQDILQVVINPNMVDGAGYFALGSGIEATCPGYNVAGGVFYQTERVVCTYESYSYPMDFMIIERSDPACNCGITNFGSLVLEEYGEPAHRRHQRRDSLRPGRLEHLRMLVLR